MSAIFDEQRQWMDSAGKPLVGGFIYIGDQNADPVLNPKDIFSDRDFTVALSQPQLIDANGRAANKIWTDGRYSIEVQDLNAVQVYSELDNGEGTESGITTLDNVLGANTITAGGSPAITAYEDLEQYVFTAAQINTGAVTLNIDSVGAKSIFKNHTDELEAGDIEEDQVVIVVYNGTDDVFEWTNQNAKVVSFYEGTPVASAAATDIWAQDGNTIHVTGTETITSLGTAPNIGARREFIADDAFTLTDGANLILQGNANYTATAGDIFEVYADTLTQFRVTIKRENGTSVTTVTVGLVLLETQTASSSTSIDFTSNIDSTYDVYILEITKAIPATDSVDPYFRVSLDGGSTFRSTAGDYAYAGGSTSSNGSAVSESNTAQTFINVNGSTDLVGNLTVEGMSSTIQINGPAAGNNVAMKASGDFKNISGNIVRASVAGEFNGTTGAVDAIQFLFSSGNIVSGTFSLYGVLK